MSKYCFIIAILLFRLGPPAHADAKKDDPPKAWKPKLIISKETTYVTDPLDDDGYPNYAAALNKHWSKGVTPQNNANVLIWQAIGPHPEGGTMPKEYFDLLGIKSPPEDRRYFLRFDKFAQDLLKDDYDHDAMVKIQGLASKRPWKKKRHANVAAWLKRNEKPLGLVVQASKRSRYFNPIVPPRKGKLRGTLLSALLPSVQVCRELADALAIRAMLRIGEGKLDEASRDLLACHRLARIVAHGPTVIEELVAVALDSIASDGDLVLLQQPMLSARLLENYRRELRQLPPFPDLAKKIDVGERMIFLDAVMSIERYGPDALDSLMDGVPKPSKEMNRTPIDWNPGLRMGNAAYDRCAKALRLTVRRKRNRELQRITTEIAAKNAEARNPKTFFKTLYRTSSLSKTRGNLICDVLLGLMLPALEIIQDAVDRQEQAKHNLRVAFALKLHHIDHRRYPEKLSELAPKYLKEIPGDLFSDGALIYRATKNGYLLYSVGPNERDDGGRTKDEDYTNYDVTIRMPVPKLRPKKR